VYILQNNDSQNNYHAKLITLKC